MPNNIIKSFAEKTGLSITTLEEYWNKAKESAKKKFKNEKNVRYWRYVVGIFKKMLKNKIKNEFIEIKLNISKELLENIEEEVCDFLINRIINETEILESLEKEKEIEKDKMLEELEDNLKIFEKKEKRDIFGTKDIEKENIFETKNNINSEIVEKYMDNLLKNNEPIKKEIKKQFNLKIVKE